MFDVFSKNNLFSSNQSGFRPSEFCFYQLFLINNEILIKSFEMRLKVYRIFLDISKGFDIVWNNGIVFKLYRNDICGKMVNIRHNDLSDRKKRVILNVRCPIFVRC